MGKWFAAAALVLWCAVAAKGLGLVEDSPSLYTVSGTEWADDVQEDPAVYMGEYISTVDAGREHGYTQTITLIFEDGQPAAVYSRRGNREGQAGEVDILTKVSVQRGRFSALMAREGRAPEMMAARFVKYEGEDGVVRGLLDEFDVFWERAD